MLTAGAAFATKAGNINWELDPDRDRELCHTGTSYESCHSFGGESQCASRSGCWWDYGPHWCTGTYTTSAQQCDIEIDSRDQDDIEEVCEKAADAMVRKTHARPSPTTGSSHFLFQLTKLGWPSQTDMASGMSTDERGGIGHVPNLHDMLRGLFEADWASYATSCRSIATQVKTTDWEEALDMDAEDASELQAWAHTVAKMCEKVKRGWS